MHGLGSLRRPLGTVLGGVVLLVSCTSGDATPAPPSEDGLTETGNAVATEAPTNPKPTSSVPTESPEDPAEEAVRAAYRQYLDSTVEAMGDRDLGRIEAARGQALAAAQGRVTALEAQGRVARGAFVPSIQSIDVDDGVAELEDCYRQDIVEHDGDSDEVVADRNGLRMAATVVLEEHDASWVVTEFSQGDVCVPSELAIQVEDRYLAFWDAVNAAGTSADPEHPGLAAVAAGEQLDGLREALTRFRNDGLEVRDASVPHPRAVQVTAADTVAIVRDCRELDTEGGVYDTETNELVEGGAEPGQRALWETRLEVIEGAWMVVDADQVEEDSACDPAAF